jgi:murein DD-endopeptidase MepM/ murein hydrolase activator NlpD
VQDYLRTIDTVLPFEDIAPTDEFDLVVSYKRAADGQGQMGDLLYAGVRGGQRAQLLRWGSQGEFMSPEAMKGTMEGASSSLLAAPVDGHITSGFGWRRHPILGYVRMHAGIDFGAAWGALIHAVSDGTVTFAGWHGGHGEYVRLDHGGGIGTGYGP